MVIYGELCHRTKLLFISLVFNGEPDKRETDVILINLRSTPLLLLCQLFDTVYAYQLLFCHDRDGTTTVYNEYN